MNKFVLLLLLLFAPMAYANPLVLFETTEGQFAVELFDDKVHATVQNFMTYVRSGYYNGTLFHRIVSNAQYSVVQGGGYTKFDREGIIEKPGLRSPIVLEARSDLSNQQYTLAMARQETPNSATAQFFINGRDNATQFDGNYAVFGKLLTGCSGCEKLIDQLLEKPIKPIRFVQFGKEAVEAKNVPVVPIRIISAKILQD